ncbi:MAG: hypothetical protein JWM40_390 [Frankiales bacterium]|nr:hypothetical protein [Frankiales bacterium]
MRALIAVTALALSLTACGSDGSSGASTAVAIKAGDTTCDVATKQFTSGDKVSFDVENTGKDVTEVYVYGKGSSDAFDKVVGEVENIAPGTSRDFTVTLSGGAYEVACKPGQKGDGIRTGIDVAGEPSATDAAYDRQVEVTATDTGFTGLAGFTAEAGEKIEFTLTNSSTTREHELEVFGPDGKAVGEVGPTAPGKKGEVVLELSKAGTYTYGSGVADDVAKGLKGSFVVS